MVYFIFHYSIDTPLGVDMPKTCEREGGKEGVAYEGTYMMKNYKIFLGYQLIKMHHDTFYISSLG